MQRSIPLLKASWKDGESDVEPPQAPAQPYLTGPRRLSLPVGHRSVSSHWLLVQELALQLWPW